MASQSNIYSDLSLQLFMRARLRIYNEDAFLGLKATYPPSSVIMAHGLIRVKQSGRTRRAVEDPALNSPTGADAMALASGNPRLGTGIRPTKAALGRSIDAVSSPGDTIKIEDSGSECSGLL
ncbi:hypothetical protein CISG_09022 [Coccidioides immitis RMSCC 3703]|uniref:Uncharacterized protein n=2 Tax=Coccidioides immitis TaxID=5501 RepID=A0A0J8R976_COCIT|nr:hypothetical protein CIRG_08786 [Coccidioides immitis RMSCC 2394]KMU81451.1 hypothetical protein CISG_09022 [Coccidioides immitis RMSCC 3703]